MRVIESSDELEAPEGDDSATSPFELGVDYEPEEDEKPDPGEGDEAV